MLPLPHRPQGLLGPKERVVLIYKGHPYLLINTTLFNSTSSGGGRHPPPLYGYRYLTQLSFQNCGLPCTTSASSSARLSTVKVDHPLGPRTVGALSRMALWFRYASGLAAVGLTILGVSSLLDHVRRGRSQSCWVQWLMFHLHAASSWLVRA